MATGKDGFDCLVGAKNLTEAVEMTPIPTCLTGHFMRLQWLSMWDEVRTKHNARAVVGQWKNRVATSKSRRLKDAESEDDTEAAPAAPGTDKEKHRTVNGVGAEVESSLCHWSVDFQELTIKPALENRIVNVSAPAAEESPA